MRVHSCGICGTDLHFWAHGCMGSMSINKPSVLGHEASGTVLKVGSNVKTLAAGDNVAVEPNEFCGFCAYCMDGRNQLCLNAFTDIPLRDGLLQQYYVVPAFMCTKVPDGMSLEAAAVAEPLACCLHAIQRVGVSCGQYVLVCGAGPMGILSALAAKAFGACRVVITDTNAKRVEHAKSLGVCQGFVIKLDEPEEKQVEAIKELLGKRNPDITLECTGFQPSMRLAIAATKKGGRICMVGLGAKTVEVPLSTASMKEIDLIGTAKYDSNSFRLGIALMAAGKINGEGIVTHKVSLENFQQAFDLIMSGEASKVLIQP